VLRLAARRAERRRGPGPCLRFDPSKLLLDPYARAIAQPAAYSREAAREPGRSNLAQALRSVVVADHSGYDWEGDAPAAPALRPDRDL
jgi:isoamylase